MVVYKLREAGRSSTGEPIRALTVPNEISVFFQNTFFHVAKSGGAIIFTSGTQQIITKKQVDNYQYEDCRIQ